LSDPLLPYDLTISAESDLKEIIRTTIKNWGEKQASVYANKLALCFNKIAENALVSRTFSKRFPQVKSVKCEHHYVFYIHSKKERPVVIAILYERMDMITRITTRLSASGINS